MVTTFFPLAPPHYVWRRYFLFAVLLLVSGRGAAQVRIMSLGNSITQGDTRHSTYRRPLWQKLQAGGYSVDFVGSLSTNSGGPNPTPDFDLDHEGHWGWRADELVVNARTWAAAARPNVVLIHAGSNDIDQGQTIASTRDDLGSLIDQLRLGQPALTVLLAQLIPTANLTNNANYTTLNALLPALAQLKTTAQSPVIVVDQNTGFNATTETTDGVHPNAVGEEKMAARWYAALQALLPPPVTGGFTLTLSTTGSGVVSKNPNQLSYLSGSSVTLTATPAAGFLFSGWSGDALGTANPLSVSMTTNKVIGATFVAAPVIAQQLVSYTLVNTDTRADIQVLTTGTTLNLATLPTRHLNIRANTSPATVGSVLFALSGAQARSQTENVTPYALFSDNGGAYYSWTPTVGSYALTARPYTGGSGGGTAGTTLAITFSVIDQAPGPFVLTVNNVGTGTVSRSPDLPTYPSSTSVVLTATPATGSTFTGWSGAALGNTNPLTVSMTANKTITATFTAIPVSYVLTVSTVGTGTVARNPNQSSYLTGTSVSLTATPATGFAFTSWSGDATGSTNPLSVAMTADKNITATFTAVTPVGYALTLNAVGNGTVSLNPDQATYPSGTSVMLTPNPMPGFQFAGWSGDATGPANPLTVVMTSDRTITATFTALATDYTLTVNPVSGGTVSKSPDQPTYPSGSSMMLTATPAAGFQFAGWSGDATGNANPLAVVMTIDKAITATFTAVPMGQQVSSFTLVNADTDLDLQPLINGAVLNLATLPTRNLNIRANTSPTPVGSVVFTLSGTQRQAQTESRVPYALFGDMAGNYSPWVPAVGSYTLTARPYTGSGGTGTAGTALTISFSVLNQLARTAPLASTNLPLRAVAYPNPSADDRYVVALPQPLTGTVKYVLRSALGAAVAAGELQLGQPTTTLPFDFSRQMQSGGVYYLLLEGAQQVLQVQLLGHQ